ncbi:O-antigen ligase family protein [Sphingomonas sp. 2SG]|uniref:O-antigen ligase family protein n=1 Tax=Sphingomonas sp. 2SG TaxID=2502201 RepID=UPI00148545EA|nr:O-antigen ligase family protein [Sphingomonas sp. 2SG]
MRSRQRSSQGGHLGLPAILLAAFLIVLWLAGGASRADVLGQVLVRGAAWGLLILAALFSPRPQVREAGAVAYLVLAAVLLPTLQLVPLPPAIWESLSGRTVFMQAVEGTQPWRPWSIVPGATWNALGSLIVPVAALVFVTTLRERERRWLPDMILALITVSTLVGLLQFSGVRFNNPFINEGVGAVNGTFANRNHFALFLTIGCILVPVWAFQGSRHRIRRIPIALGLLLLFILVILASGSRAGLGLGVFAVGLGLAIVWKDMHQMLRGAPRWTLPAIILGIVTVISIFVLVSVVAGRAQSITRVLSVDPSADMRSRALPTIMTMIETYFPWGSGFGGFDPIFRMHEPFNLLKLTFFNHAHNDFLEVVLEGGIFGAALLLGALIWWGMASLRAIRSGDRLQRLGTGILLLVIIASGFDYPARTPLIMAICIIAAWWLNGAASYRHTPALPADR